MKKWFAKGKILALIAMMVLTAAFTVSCSKKEEEQKTETDEPEEINFTFYQEKEAENLGNPADVGVMIMDCDDTSYFKTLTNATLINRSGKYVQGTGALAITSLLSTTTASCYFEDVDISDYAEGSIHMSLYVSDPEYFENPLVVELTSSGKYDEDELSWQIPASALEPGWNDLYLGIEDAKVTGEPDLGTINFCRFYTMNCKLGLDVIYDNVYAADTKGMSLEAKAKVVASTKPGYLMDCDTLTGLTSNGILSLSTAKGEYKEGDGAVIISNPDTVWVRANLMPVDLSDYERGNISFWIYINNASYVKNSTITVEISSAGMYDKEELSWNFSGSELHAGWNEVTLGISTGKETPDGIDLSKINYLRIFGEKCDEKLVLILDAIRYSQAVKRVPGDGMILNCDTDNAMIIKTKNDFSITTTAGEYKEGTGAFKLAGSDISWLQVQMSDLVDVSGFADGGLHLWLYVSDSDKLKNNLTIELGSGGNYDVDEYQWAVAGLHTGWNELNLTFSSAAVTGSPDLCNLNWFRVYGARTGDMTVIIDDVRAVNIEKKVVAAGMILDCDSASGMTVQSNNKFFVTTEESEYKEGTGAFKSVGSETVWWQMKLGTPADASTYADGGIHLWLYVSDSDKLKNMVTIELGSGGKYDVDEYQWNISALQTGWNELNLAFDTATVTGSPDLSNLNWLRIFGSCTGEITAILDDVRAVNIEKATVAAGTILNCDSIDGITVNSNNKFSITGTEGEYKEGTGAFKAVGTGAVWYQAKLGTPVDLSDYADDGISFWLYIDDISRFTGNVYVEIGSAGQRDVYEYQWNYISDLTSGWNEVQLKFADAKSTTDGGADLSSINWFRIFTAGTYTGDITTILDNVHAIEIEPDPEEEPKEPVAGMILDCDSLQNASVVTRNESSVTTAEGEFKEGIGAFKSVGNNIEWWRITLNTAVDISDHADDGFHIWLYVSDTSKLSGDVTVELGSAGIPDTEEYQWRFSSGSLKDGWQELYFDFASAVKSVDGGADLSRINWFRIYGNTTGNITFLLDDIRAVEGQAGGDEPGQEEDTKGMILSCDSKGEDTVQTNRASFSVTTADGEHKEGIGAFKTTGSSGNVWYQAILKTPVDISEYADGGISFWLYISDVDSFAGDMYVELGSAGKADTNEYRWNKVSGLTSGWNELKLMFADAISLGGTADLSRINWLRIWVNNISYTGEITTILDNVHAIKGEAKEEEPGQEENTKSILSCDNRNGITVQTAHPSFSLTTAEGEHKEGTGAFKTAGSAGAVWYQVIFGTPVNLSEYADGSISFWLYISDINRFTGDMYVEIGSAGKADTNEYQWNKVSGLTSGWNEIELKFADVRKSPDGGADLSKINWFRIWFNGMSYRGEVTTILDDLHAIKPDLIQ